jgi:hypothetical protein
MKAVIWKDEKNRLRRSLIRDEDGPEMAPYGIPVGPPDVDRLDWHAIKEEVAQALLGQEIYTWRDAQAHPDGITAAINVLKRHLIQLYKLDEQEIKQESKEV